MANRSAGGIVTIRWVRIGSFQLPQGGMGGVRWSFGQAGKRARSASWATQCARIIGMPHSRPAERRFRPPGRCLLGSRARSTRAPDAVMANRAELRASLGRVDPDIRAAIQTVWGQVLRGRSMPGQHTRVRHSRGEHGRDRPTGVPSRHTSRWRPRRCGGRPLLDTVRIPTEQTPHRRGNRRQTAGHEMAQPQALVKSAAHRTRAGVRLRPPSRCRQRPAGVPTTQCRCRLGIIPRRASRPRPRCNRNRRKESRNPMRAGRPPASHRRPLATCCCG